MLKRNKKISHDSSGEVDRAVVMEDAQASGLGATFSNRWTKPLVITAIAIVGAIGLGLSLASSPTLTKAWATNADWNSGTLDNVAVSNNAVSLAANTTIASTTKLPKASVTASNIALNKPVTCSSVEDTQDACKYVNDGDQNTRWSSKFRDPQSVSVNLGLAYDISEVKISWQAYAQDYQLQTSNDAKTWTTIYSGHGIWGNQDITSLKGSGRYIRVLATKRATQWGDSIFELAVYGTPAQTGGTSAYAPTGSETVTFDATSAAQWTNLTHVDNQPSGTSITYQYRTSSDKANWSSWADVSTIAQAPQTRYIQIKATLSTTNGSTTPTLSQLTLSYTTQSHDPAVSLTASSSTVASGQAATLNWSSQNTDSCTASGGWSGSKATVGSASTGALTQTTTFNLACTGSGGTANSSVTVTVTTSSGSSGGSGSSAYACTIVGASGSCPDWPGYTTHPTITGIGNLTVNGNPPIINADIWSGDPNFQSTVYANSPSDWKVVASVNASLTSGGVEAYPNVGFYPTLSSCDSNNFTAATCYIPVDSSGDTTSSWNVTIPTDTSKVVGWSGYDLWFNGDWSKSPDEIMVLTDITANSNYDCTPQATATFGGMPWHLCVFGSWPHPERVWKPGTDDQHLVNQASGTIDVKAMLQWMEQHKDPASGNYWLSPNSTWYASSFGFEICNTSGTSQTFKVNNFTWNQQ